MSKTVTLPQQVSFMRQELDTREESFPLRVEMKRMTQKEADEQLAVTRAILATLERAQAFGDGPVVTMEPKVARLWPTFLQVQQCAKEHAENCLHCRATANVLEEAMK